MTGSIPSDRRPKLMIELKMPVWKLMNDQENTFLVHRGALVVNALDGKLVQLQLQLQIALADNHVTECRWFVFVFTMHFGWCSFCATNNRVPRESEISFSRGLCFLLIVYIEFIREYEKVTFSSRAFDKNIVSSFKKPW